MEAAELDGWFEAASPRIRIGGDPDREVAERYGVSRLSWLQLITGRTLRQGFRAARAAGLPLRPGGDPLGRPALFVVDRRRRVTFAHIGSDMADRPDWDQIFNALSGD